MTSSLSLASQGTARFRASPRRSRPQIRLRCEIIAIADQSSPTSGDLIGARKGIWATGGFEAVGRGDTGGLGRLPAHRPAMGSRTPA